MITQGGGTDVLEMSDFRTSQLRTDVVQWLEQQLHHLREVPDTVVETASRSITADHFSQWKAPQIRAALDKAGARLSCEQFEEVKLQHGQWWAQ